MMQSPKELRKKLLAACKQVGKIRNKKEREKAWAKILEEQLFGDMYTDFEWCPYRKRQ